MFSNGVVSLAVVAGLLVILFGGVTTALIPLYAVGVFAGFTLSQAGMVLHHQKDRARSWRRLAVLNAVGAITTGAVLVVVVVSKFAIGAWIPTVLIPLIVVVLKAINRHYRHVADVLRAPPGTKPRTYTNTVVVLVGSVHKGVLSALSYARSLHPDRLVAVSVVGNDAEAARITKQWQDHGIDIELHLLHSPYRELTTPVLHFLDELDSRYDDDIITVVLPEFVLDRWWHHLLHNQSALMLKARLLFRPHSVVISVPIHLAMHRDHEPDRAAGPEALEAPRS